MSLMSYPKMFVSDTVGWSDLARRHPRVMRTLTFYVMPLSLLPPVMYAYAEWNQPGVIFALIEPPMSLMEAVVIGITFFAIEVGTVALMANFIQQLAESRGVLVDYADAYTFAAIAPTPMWLAPLALAIPSAGFNVGIMVVAWLGTVALIRHGVRPLLGVTDATLARRMANAITLLGVATWMGLLMLLVMTISLVLGWR